MSPKDIYLTNNVTIGATYPTFIIAEIGQNHQGNIETAKKLIKRAKECGAHCVKFQKTCISEKFTQAALDAPYLNDHSWGKTYREHKEHLEFSDEQFKELQNFSKEVGILFSASAMDEVSLKLLVKLEVPFIKIGSGDANNFLLIDAAARTNVPLIISTGMSHFHTVKSIYELVSKFHKNFALLHCVSSYPTPYEDVNLNVLALYKESFPDINIGYSGHEIGTHISVAAVALGAKIIERHITLDKTQKGSDHKCSLEPSEFKLMVDNIRTLEKAMGTRLKEVYKSESTCYKKLGKTVVANKSLSKGHKLSLEDLAIKVSQPKGLDATRIYEVIGLELKQNIEKDEPILHHVLFKKNI